MGVDPMEVPVHWAAPGTRPWDSPGMPSPVGLPNPRLAIWLRSRVSPRPWAISMVPMLEDWARIWVAVMATVPCCSASWNVYLPMGRAAGTDRVEPGLMTLSARAAEKVTSLNTEPGS